MTDNDFLIDQNANTSADLNPVSEAPTRSEATRFALTDAPRGETDEASAVKAEYLGNVYFDLLQKAQRGIDPNQDDSAARAEAVYFSEAMTGRKDVYGKLWRKGGFKTGREYLAKMHDFFLNGGERNLTQAFRDFRAKSYEEQVAEALANRKGLDALSHAIGNAAGRFTDWANRSGNDGGLTRAEEAEAPEDVRRASAMLAARGHLATEHSEEEYAAATEAVRSWREKKYNERVRAEYAAKLLADNAWHELSAILPEMTEDGRACAKALMESKDNRLPETMWAKFNGLDDQEKQLVCRARTCLAPRVEGSVANTVGDMAIGAANIAANVIAAPYRFGNKLGMMASNEAFDAGFDVNELARRRQYLWQATGRFLAGEADGGYLPQLQFEQICQDHGFLAESLIGAVTTLPYMAAAAVPGIGIATVAIEAMNEMDDHVAMSGGDITDPDYIFSNALFGAMYAYTERLQVEKLLGAVSELEIREAMLKGFFHGVKDRQAIRTLTVGTLAESLQEGLQNGIMQANEALALDQDATRAFADGFTQDFIGSLGTMFVVEAGGLVGGHWKRSGFNNGFTEDGRLAGRAHRSSDLDTIYEADMSKARLVDYAKDVDRIGEEFKDRERRRLLTIWTEGGKDALVEDGIDPVRAEEWDYFFSSLRNDVENETVPDAGRADKAANDIASYIQEKMKKELQQSPEEAQQALAETLSDLEHVRSVWAKGAGLMTKKGKDIVVDAGAKALEEIGFTPEYAKRISERFHYERAAAYSPAALDGIRKTYEASLGDRVGAVAAMAQQFGGQVVHAQGNTYLKFDRADGTQLVQIVESSYAVDFTSYSEGLAVSIEKATDGKVTKEDWKKMTPDERRSVWTGNIETEGDFRKSGTPVEIVLTSDPSARVTSDQAAKVIGTIRVSDATPNARVAMDSSAVFHETYHAFSYFAQASGLWTREDAAYLAKRYGEAKAVGETHDEETAAEGFREYLVRRAAGALTAEDEKSPFAKIYASAAGLDGRAKERAVQENMATESEKNFFDQLVADANARPAPVPATEKPTAAPQNGIKPEKEETAPVNGNAAPVKAEGPKAWTAFTPTGNVKVSGYWAVYDLSEIIHSNNPLYAKFMRAQLRDRKANKAEEDTRNDIVNNFQGERLLEAPDTANGAPIVFIETDDDGVKHPFVLSGNGRVLVLNELANRHLYDRYRNVMKKWAAENGIAVPEGETPILVRVIDDYGGSNRDKVADLSNTNSIQQYNEEEQARADAEIVKALDLARLYQANADGTPDMTPGVNDNFFNAFIRGVGDTSLYNSDRTLTQAARDRAQRALLAIAVGQGKSGRDVVKKLVEQTDTLGMTRQKNAAAMMAAPVAALEKKTPYAIGADVSRAMADYMDFSEKKKAGKIGTFDEYERQPDLLDRRSYIATEILKLFGSPKSAAAMAEHVKTYCRAAEMEDPAGGLFGAARTREEIWRDAAKLVDEDAAEKRYSIAKRTELLETHRGNDESSRFSTVAAAIDTLKDARTSGSVTEAAETLKASGVVNKPLTNRILGLTAKITGNCLSKMTSEKATKKSRSPYLHALAVANADKIFECAFSDATHPDTHGRKEVAQVHRLGSMLYDPQAMRFEPVLVTMLEYKRDGGKVYTIEAIDVDAYRKKNSAGQLVAFADGERQTPIAEYVGIIANRVAAFNGEIVRFSTTGLYTGSAADYEKPSLLKVGTGEGSQVYGWGLYASSERGVAEMYADMDAGSGEFSSRGNKAIKFKNRIIKVGDGSPDEIAADFLINYGDRAEEMITSDIENNIRANDRDHAKELKAGLRSIQKFRKGFEVVNLKPHVYEQTFFTNRAPGDESHLLKWYEPVSEETAAILDNAFKGAGVNVKTVDGNGIRRTQYRNKDGYLILQCEPGELTGEDAYRIFANKDVLGSPKAASEWLAEHDIDGIKYPVDSYGGKTVKDGDTAGWNYVSFRDDNIRVDHKWVDGQQRFSTVSLPSGEKVAVIDRDDEIAKINLEDPKSVHDYLLVKVGQQIFDNLVIGSEAPTEYIYSEDAKGNNKRIRKAKAKLATGLDNAAEVAGNASTEIATHKERQGGVYYRRSFLFAVKSGFDGRYRAYSADMVSYMKDDVEQFYDVVNIEDAPSISADLTQLSSRIAASGTSRIPADGGATIGSIAQSDAETQARRAVKAYAQESAKAAEDALENYVAYFKLSHGSIPRARTIARMGLSLGMPVVDSKRILKNADKLADRAKGSLIEKAAKNGDVGTAMSLLKREKDIDKAVDNLIAGGVTLGGQLTHKGVGQVNALRQKRIDRMMASMNAATLADMEGDTGLDLAAEILSNNPDAFDVEYRKAKKPADEGATAEEDENGSGAPAASEEERELSDSERYTRAQILKEANEKVAKFIEEAKARAEDNKQKAEERRKRIQEIGGTVEVEDGGIANVHAGNDPYNPTPTVGKANFKTPGEFAAFLRVWAQHKFAKTHGLTTLGRVEQDRLFAEFYRLCVKQELQDLADKLLAPTDETGTTNARLAKLGAGARVLVNRRLAEMEKGITPDRIERMSADIFAFINKAAIRVSRVDLITSFKAELKERFLEDPDFDEFKQDTERKVTGWVEEATRYICRVCDLSRKSVNGDQSQLEQEYQRLHEIIDRRQQVYDESGKEVAAAAQEDAETLKAQWMLALLDKFGAMRSLMPGEILDLQNAAFSYLEDEAAKLEEAWRDTRAQQEQVRRDFSAAIQGPNGQRYDSKGAFAFMERLFDGLNGLIRLRLKHLTRFADPETREKADDAINSILVRLGDGETAFARALQDDRDNLFRGLAQIFQKDGRVDNGAIKHYLARMDEKIPAELARQISNQGFAESMTYGQMLQLLVSLEQRSFKDAITANGRDGQAELIRTFTYADENGNRVRAFTREDDAFVDFLRAFYAAKRDSLSEVTMRMVGHKVDSPDPLYCPVRRWVDDKARGLHADPTSRWDPISKIFSRRVESDRDFDESRTIIGLFYENSRESAKLTAWAERGSFIRNVVTSTGFQTAVKRAFGAGELGKILKQLEATFNGGEIMKDTPAELAAVDKALNFTTYAYLGFNPLSAAKQTTSFTVWANALPGGFKDLWRHMTHFDKDVVKHLKESEEYKVRYGNDVGSGQDMATKGLNANPSSNPFMRTITGAGMWLLKKGDFAPGIWIAQGVYKDILDRHLNEGMAHDEADRLAITETFNMLEETQQSGRTYNTNMLTIEHGRIGRLLTQFATTPLQQLQYQTQALREWRDMVKYNQGEKKIAAARQRFYRAALINHVLLPAALNLVIAIYKAAMGEEPPWEKDGYHWTLLTEILMGQLSRIFFLGAFAQTTLNALFKRETPRAGQLLPVEGALGMGVSAGILVHDIATMDVDRVQKDLERVIKGTAPTRIPYNVYRRLTGDADVDRKAKEEAAKRK